VSDAAKLLENGATSVTVRTKAEAEELFLGLFQGKGYTNTTSMGAMDAKNLQGGTFANTYHWDNVFDSSGQVINHGVDNIHGELPHLQIHTKEGDKIRIFFGE
jgi:hypothetical protein